ncbi:MAG: cobalt transporter CbiM [Methanothrix sp.]|uniref:Cobalamin (Vitamin B12) biosynthesis CbiM protein n=1 Tax=Methanothrix harundinacea TaxID=301375 RepID=A0A101IG11_9EURY|nr:MAG: Cobalamin (Vitamin B12) biosynthesis CbiM protein [Methanothrix harundinacea]MDD2637904.1 cobalt transporter CbiM [Methanothrix sp.]KUK94580.1 MAG: Cobalamin (Vitamin B12) biosynthesis CbiM protein [Methanothrix harundinacea]MCP1391573.1 cobalt transporter CbiM [Methanothrix harundinacea]MDD3709598.1 cobalt transporter CbiM [Methanothrix sp.]
MVHISDGVLPLEVLAAGFVLSGILLFLTLRGVRAEEIPRISLITAALFVASLVHFPVGPTSVHLIMNGLAGIILGKRAFVSVLVALTLQAIFFQHGGISVIGVNSLNMGIPALLAWQVFERRRGFGYPRREIVFGAVAGAVAVLGAVLLLSAELLLLGEGFSEIATLVLMAHIPIVIIEAAVLGTTAGYLDKVKPEMLVPAKAGQIRGA